MAKILMKGNEAIGEAAMRAGLDAFFGYPITPQNELPEYMSREMPKRGKVFVQAESEIAAINMVYGAAGCGKRVMTSSSSPGIALKQEGISYIAACQLPCVIVSIGRGGPGLGGIQPAQADYNQSTRGGGNGDYKLLVYAPANIQEMCDMIMDSFPKAEEYRTPVMIVADGMIGQMMEPVEFKEMNEGERETPWWATTGTKNKREHNIVNSLFLKPDVLERHNIELFEKFKKMQENEQDYELYNMEDDCEIVTVAYGTTSRIVRNAIDKLAAEGRKVGLIRPKTLWPFPTKAFEKYPKNAKAILVVEMSMGQMIDDVRATNEGRLPVDFYGRSGGMIPTPEAVEQKLREMLGGK
ncbi:MAG: 3-methyl-2-oxobutanoate dehydrogenase subunit VorB [Bacillota bacterium]|nr:3-methyl-2-oxobutanoate dehydrogenase subunit VorB [Bacillota bacterium]